MGDFHRKPIHRLRRLIIPLRLIGDYSPLTFRRVVAHCNGLAAAGVITREEADRINAGLQSVLAHEDDSAYFDQMASEDVHSFVEARLVEIVGDAGRKLHTGRSRNDQVATDLRLWLRGAIDQLSDRCSLDSDRPTGFRGVQLRRGTSWLYAFATRAADTLRTLVSGLL